MLNIQTSEHLDKFAPSLIGVQKEISPAIKDTVNGHFKNKYADVVAVWEASHEALPKWEIAVHQGCVVYETGAGEAVHLLATTLLHSSGQWVRGFTPLIFGQNNMQSVAGAMTYARRYGVMAAIFMVSDDDDDGESAVGRPATIIESTVKKVGSADDITAKNFYAQARAAGIFAKATAAQAKLAMKPTSDANAKALWDEMTRE